MKFWQTFALCGLCISPFFVMATKVDADEFMKSGIGVGLAGVAAIFIKAIHKGD